MPGSPGHKAAMSDDAFRGRKSEMIVALNMFLDHPIRGVGLGNYDVYYQKYSRKIFLDSRLEKRQAHSRYLEALAETGLVGFGAFCLIIWMMFRELWLARKAVVAKGINELADTITAFGIGMVGFLTTSIFLHDDFARFFWLLIGIAFAIPNIVKYELEQQKHA
jgi:O-antigen ligase